MIISIILATYNWPQVLDIILLQLTAQVKTNLNFEIIIADDGSDINTTNIIKKYQNNFKNIIHIWHEDQGFRKAMILNKAVAKAKGEYLIFLDGDCIPFTDYIQEHLFLAEKGFFIAGNRVLLSKQFTQQILSHPEIINNVLKWRLFQWLYAKFRNQVNKIFPRLKFKTSTWRYFRSNDWKYPKGCNFAMWKDDFIAVNGFDESFSGWGHEDADLFIRLIHNKIKIKDGRFSIPVLHMWHNLANRTQEKTNKLLLLSRVNDKTLIKAKLGINQYL